MDINSGQVKTNPQIPHVSPGDSVKVVFKVRETSRERFQTFPGLVVKVKKGASGGNFTIRRIASGIGVEHTFPFASPLLEKIEVLRHGKVRRAKLYYIRRLSAKEARLKERRERITERVSVEEGIVGEAVAESVTEEVATKETMAEEVVIGEAEVEQVVAEDIKGAENVVEEAAVQESAVNEAVSEEATAGEFGFQEDTVDESAAQEDVVEDAIDEKAKDVG